MGIRGLISIVAGYIGIYVDYAKVKIRFRRFDRVAGVVEVIEECEGRYQGQLSKWNSNL